MITPEDDLPDVTRIPDNAGLSELADFMKTDDINSVRSFAVRVSPASLLSPKSELNTHFFVEAFHVAEMST